MTDLLVWAARALTLVNVVLALVAWWGLSMGSPGARHQISQAIGAALFVAAVGAALAAFRPISNISTPAFLILISAPVVWLPAAIIGPPGETPVRDAILGLAAFACPPALIALACWLA